LFPMGKKTKATRRTKDRGELKAKTEGRQRRKEGGQGAGKTSDSVGQCYAREGTRVRYRGWFKKRTIGKETLVRSSFIWQSHGAGWGGREKYQVLIGTGGKTGVSFW